MRQLTANTAKQAEIALNSPEGKDLLAYLTKAVGLTERTFILDKQGNIDPYRAAIKDGERAIVSLLVKLQNGETFEQHED